MSNRDDQIWAAHERGGTAVSTVRVYTGTTGSKCNALPAEWGAGDYWVTITAVSYAAHCLFTDQSDLTASVPTATDAGASAVGMGNYLPAGAPQDYLVPHGCTYFCRIAAGTTNIEVALSSNPGRQT